VHVLTKIFIVLVTLLTVLLVPLVVVYAHNENSYRGKFEESRAETESAVVLQRTAETRLAGAEARLQARLDELMLDNRTLQTDLDSMSAAVRIKDSELASSDGLKSEIHGQLAVLVSAVDSSQKLTDGLIGEMNQLRSGSLADKRQLAELDEALRDISSQLEVAVAARRALAEELYRLKDENAIALERVAQYVARYGELGGVAAGGLGDGPVPDRDLNATIISVRRSPDQTLAEIDAGQVDGVQEGWLMTIGHGGVFKGNLRIIDVELNHATGMIELEEPENRGKVEVGHRATARKGRD
jgi:hypothetical protein